MDNLVLLGAMVFSFLWILGWLVFDKLTIKRLRSEQEMTTQLNDLFSEKYEVTVEWDWDYGWDWRYPLSFRTRRVTFNLEKKIVQEEVM